MYFVWFSLQTVIISSNSVNQLIFAMVKSGVFFAVRTEFLNIIWTSFGFKGLTFLLTRLSAEWSCWFTIATKNLLYQNSNEHRLYQHSNEADFYCWETYRISLLSTHLSERYFRIYCWSIIYISKMKFNSALSTLNFLVITSKNHCQVCNV
jgi:hypothetical protein